MARARAETSARLAALEERVKRLDAALSLLARPLEQLDVDIESELAQLALGVGKQLARRELRAEPAQVIAILRESLALLPAAAREVRVHLHPEDAATVREHLSAPAADRAWTIVEDPTLSRGGCVIHSQSSRIDARLEARIAAVAASVLGDERTAAREGQ
jgi:flagellar assembly protein FliH